MKGYGFELPREIYDDDEVFVIGDQRNVGGFLSSENVGYEEEDDGRME